MIIKEYAKIVMNNVSGQNNWAARNGGEHFLICLTNTNIDNAVNVAKNIKEEIENKTFQYEGTKVSVTASFGLCSVNGENINTQENLIECANNKLYEAKDLGKNRICY